MKTGIAYIVSISLLAAGNLAPDASPESILFNMSALGVLAWVAWRQMQEIERMNCRYHELLNRVMSVLAERGVYVGRKEDSEHSHRG